uniref:Kinase n=1 Tax=Anopheles christyi TaxID=43041 RepID=A0A182KGK3_9DIPT
MIVCSFRASYKLNQRYQYVLYAEKQKNPKHSSPKRIDQTMPICTLPTVTIYEDFDKLSAKEVYFTESGDKVTVKLLHFPNLSPEEQDHLKTMSDSGDEHGLGNANAPGTSGEPVPRTRKKSFTRKLSNDARKFSALTSRKNSKDADLTTLTGGPNIPPSHQHAAGQHHHHHHHYHHHHHQYQLQQGQPSGVPHQHQHYQQQLVRQRTQSTSHSQYHYQNQLPIVQHPAGDGGRSECVGGGAMRHRLGANRSPSPRQSASLCPGYEQYQMSLLEVPMPRDYGDASSDDLSSEWDSDVPDVRHESGAKVSRGLAFVGIRNARGPSKGFHWLAVTAAPQNVTIWSGFWVCKYIQDYRRVPLLVKLESLHVR